MIAVFVYYVCMECTLYIFSLPDGWCCLPCAHGKQDFDINLFCENSIDQSIKIAVASTTLYKYYHIISYNIYSPRASLQ